MKYTKQWTPNETNKTKQQHAYQKQNVERNT